MERVAVFLDNLSHYSVPWDLLLVGALTLVVVAVGSYGSRRRKAVNLPPGPRNWPVIGAFPALLGMEPKLHKVFHTFATTYGPIAYFRLGVQDIAVVSSAEAAEELLKHKDAEFSDRETQMSKTAVKYAAMEGKVVAFANFDAELKLHRKILMTELFSGAKLKVYENLRTQEMAVMVEKIFAEIGQSKSLSGGSTPMAPMDLRSITMAPSTNLLVKLMVGDRLDNLPLSDELRKLTDMVEELSEMATSFNLGDIFPWLSWLDLQGIAKRLKQFGIKQNRFYKVILEKNRQAVRHKGVTDEKTPRNFVQTLLRAQEDGTWKISDIGIMSEVLAVLSGGTDSTGSQMEWVLLQLVRHPKLLRRLQDELDAVVGKERPLEEADLQAMPFLNAAVQESLRLNGVVPFSFPHVNLEPSTLCGYDIPAKTAVFLNTYSMGRDPKKWKNPLEYDPDRFLPGGSAETIKANGNHFTLLPFSSGRRVCPGYNLAIVIIARVVGSLVHAFDWAPPPGIAPEDLSTVEGGPFVLRPDPDVYLVPTPRLSSTVYKSSSTA